MEKTFKIDFSTFFHILALAKWKLKELPSKDEDDVEDFEICRKLMNFLEQQEEDFFEIKGSNPF